MTEIEAKNLAPKGVLTAEYATARVKRKAFAYRLRRRADEVINAIKTFCPDAKDLLDLGPAEGKSLSLVQDAFDNLRCTGLEYTQALIDMCTDDRLIMVQGDAMHPPFDNASFDVVTATALIEHVDNPREMLKEVWRVLCPGGIVVITTPDPVFERVAVAIGHLKDEDHQETMNLRSLKIYLEDAGFEPVRLDKFMCWPWGLPGERGIESIMKKIGLRSLLLNQIVVGRKSLNG